MFRSEFCGGPVALGHNSRREGVLLLLLLLLCVRLWQISRGAVICMQEVGIQWAGDLHVYFMARGYAFVTAHYGKHFNNYMGEKARSSTSIHHHHNDSIQHKIVASSR